MVEASLLAIFFGDLHCTSVMTGCDRDLDKYGGIFLWFLLMLYMFKALGAICDEYFVSSLEVIVEKLQVSNDVAGATFMAAGSSAPELFTSLVATFLIVNAGGVGTIVGSAIFNILVMNGVTAFVACKDQTLLIWWYPLMRDCTFYLISIAELVIFLADEEIHVWEGLIMVCTYFLYCLYMKFNPNIVAALGITNPSEEEDTPEDAGTENGANGDEVCNHDSAEGGAPVSGVSAASVGRLSSCDGGLKPAKKEWSYRKSQMAMDNHLSLVSVIPVDGDALDALGDDGTTKPPPDRQVSPAESSRASSLTQEQKGWCRDPIILLWEWTMPSPEHSHGFTLFTLSILWIGICTYVMVDSTNRIGIILTVPPFVMGLIFLAAGTSIPDTLGSIAVARQGEGDMAIANALGSNVFDILIGLGVPWTIRTMIGKAVTFPGQFDDFKGDIIILVASLVVFVAALCINKWMLNRMIGAVLIVVYAFFVLYQLLAVFAFEWKTIEERRLLPLMLGLR